MNRRQWIRTSSAMLSASTVIAARSARADWKPTHSITWAIPVAPGGSVDLYARAIKTELEAMNLLNGQNIIAENKPGAAGLLAMQVLERNPGDAHFLTTFNTGSIAGSASGALKTDIRDYVPVAMMLEETHFVVVRADSPLRSIGDLVDALRRDPGHLRIAAAPLPGRSTHLAIAKPLKAAGIDVRELTVVPFRSSAESMTGLIGGIVEVASATGPALLPYWPQRVRALAATTSNRAGDPFAAVPTWREQGIDAEYLSYNGVQLPPRVSADAIRFWEDGLRKVSVSPRWKRLVESSGNTPRFVGYVESRRYMEREYMDTVKLLDDLGLANVPR